MKKQIFRKLAYFLATAVLAFGLSGCQQNEEQAHDHDHHHHALKFDEPHGEDLGMLPWAMNIQDLTTTNENYRHAMWTGNFMQLAFMSLQPGEKIDKELHMDHDQFFRVEKGEARILMGETEDAMTFDQLVYEGWGIMVPAGYWHEVQNTGQTELRLYTIYGPAEHHPGTIHATYEEAAEDHHHHH